MLNNICSYIIATNVVLGYVIQKQPSQTPPTKAVSYIHPNTYLHYDIHLLLRGHLAFMR